MSEQSPSFPREYSHYDLFGLIGQEVTPITACEDLDEVSFEPVVRRVAGHRSVQIANGCVLKLEVESVGFNQFGCLRLKVGVLEGFQGLISGDYYYVLAEDLSGLL